MATHVSSSGTRLVLLRGFAISGLLLSAFLVYQKITGSVTYLHGCGTAGGCANVLGSRWSQWFHIPVAALSLLLYLAVLALSFRPRGMPLTLLGVTLLGAPLWFGGLQVFDLHQFCPWCLAAHLIGFTCGILIFLQPSSQRSSLSAWAGGLAALAVLAAGQIFGPIPDTHVETTVQVKPEVREDGSRPAQPRDSGRVVTLSGIEYQVNALPHLGNPEAPHVMAEYFDYTCDACRDTGEDLAAALEKYPDQLCIVLLPCPINRTCNPNIPPNLPNVEDHPHACELARLALACWRADPGSFPAVHAALFRRPVVDAAAALAVVQPLLHAPLSAEAQRDPWIDQVLADSFSAYKSFTQPPGARPNFVMPKLLLGNDHVVHGVTRTREILFSTLEKEFALAKP